MSGRYPAGMENLHRFDGTASDKARLKAIFDAMYRVIPLGEACDQVGLRQRRLGQLRDRALQGALDAIRPRPAGRPSRQTTAEARRIDQLEQELAEKDLELQEALVRAEIALILPQRVDRGAEKGGRRPTVKLGKRQPR